MKNKAVTTSRNPKIDTKQITLKSLRDLKAKLYASAAKSIQDTPHKAIQIQQRTDADASKIAFAINLISFKM